jgi:hypothetical protein
MHRDDPEMRVEVARLLRPFVEEALTEGGVDAARSLWQKPGRGSASGSGMFPGGIDVRYLRFLAEALYQAAELSDEPLYHRIADAHVRYMARSIGGQHPTWALGNALEMIGLYHRFNERDEELVRAAGRLVEAARARRVQVRTRRGTEFCHFPCGYGVLQAKDAGWTNDLSMLGSGLVCAYELLGEEQILEEAASFAEYFVQPWEPEALGEDGYWACGTWSESLGSWVIGPAHFTGFESTEVFADQASWVFSTATCIDFLTRLYQHRRDPRFLECSARAAGWTFRECQFPDGGVGICGRDDKWLGATGLAITQAALLAPFLAAQPRIFARLREGAANAMVYLERHLPITRVEEHGVEWVERRTTTDPLVNVAMLWAAAVLGWQNGRRLEQGVRPGEHPMEERDWMLFVLLNKEILTEQLRARLPDTEFSSIDPGVYPLVYLKRFHGHVELSFLSVQLELDHDSNVGKAQIVGGSDDGDEMGPQDQGNGSVDAGSRQ